MKSTNDSIKLARDAFELAEAEFTASHRPRIKIHAAEIILSPPEKADETDQENRIGASLLCFNVGESVAKDVEVRGQIFAGTGFATDVQRPIVKTEVKVLSGQKLRAEIKSDYPASTVAAGRRTGIEYHCLGWIAYFDENGDRRETGFCLRAVWDGRGDRWVSAGKPEYEYEF